MDHLYLVHGYDQDLNPIDEHFRVHEDDIKGFIDEIKSKSFYRNYETWIELIDIVES